MTGRSAGRVSFLLRVADSLVSKARFKFVGIHNGTHHGKTLVGLYVAVVFVTYAWAPPEYLPGLRDMYCF